MNKVNTITPYIDSKGTVYRRLDWKEGKTEWERIDFFVGACAVYEGCPMEHPVRELGAEEYYDFVYKGIKPPIEDEEYASPQQKK